MRRPTFIARQSANPSGIIGRVLAWIMASETSAHNESALTVLQLKPTDRVLELGFGHGRTIEELARATPEGLVAGIDHSEEMLRVAADRCGSLIRAGRVELRQGDSCDLPYPDQQFDKVLAVHTVYFWSKPLDHLKEAARVLRGGGLLVLGFRPKEDLASRDFPETVYTFYATDEMKALLESAGFTSVELISVSPSFVVARAVRLSSLRTGG